ncbi:hypothetical protein Tco_0806667 [Tanacetum coccineum]
MVEVLRVDTKELNAEGVEELKRIVRIKGEKKEALHTLRQKPWSLKDEGEDKPVDPEVIVEKPATPSLQPPHIRSSSHQGDDDEDDGASRASTPSPATYINSLKPLNY